LKRKKENEFLNRLYI